MNSIQSNKRTRDQIESLSVGAHLNNKKLKADEKSLQPYDVAQAFTICPACNGKLIKPSTLPCGYTVCQSCISTTNTCVSPTCKRVHTIPTQPNVVIQQLQTIVTSYESSHSLDALRSSFNLPTECPICCTRFTNPTTTPCGHTFCRNCLVRSLDHQRSCPFCRDSLDFCPPPTLVLTTILTQLYIEQDDDESADVHTINDFDSSDTRVPLLIGSLSFPHINCVIHVFEPRYRLMLRRIMSSSRRRFAMCLARRNRTQQQQPFYEYGTILELMHVQTLPDGRSIVQAVGSHRFKVTNFDLVDGYHMADIERIDDIDREQESLLEQQQILKASAMRARQQQQQQQQQSSTPTAAPTPARPMAAAVRPMVARPMVARPMAAASARPMAARPMAARPMAARPMSARPQQPQAQTTPMMGQQRQSWAQRAHPQTQGQVNRAPWLQMHVQGLSAAQPKPHMAQAQAQQQRQQETYANASLMPTEKVAKNRQEQSTNELLEELATFVEKLLQLKQGTGNISSWLNALGDPPVLRGANRDAVVMIWWVVNMIPVVSEDEKLPLLAMRTLRERVLLVISWVDKFEDQWSLFLTNPNSSSIANNTNQQACCIS